MSSENLKECPFCESRECCIVREESGSFVPYCTKCFAFGPPSTSKKRAKGQAEATERWNARAGQEWQPIETAPKDDTIVLGFAAYEDGCYVVAACVFKHGGWVIVGFLNGDDVPIDLTHWMPLPKPPEVEHD